MVKHVSRIQILSDYHFVSDVSVKQSCLNTVNNKLVYSLLKSNESTCALLAQDKQED